MSRGRHKTTKSSWSVTYSPQWSGITFAPHCPNRCTCSVCRERLHIESTEHYCPVCDDFRAGKKGCNMTTTKALEEGSG